MTGNTKVWRAPLAGLASVAMLATMGVAAGTASAATIAASDVNLPSASKLTFEWSDGTAGSCSVPGGAVAGETLADAFGGFPVGRGADGSKEFVGWHDGSKLADWSSRVSGDKTLKAKYVEDAVQVVFSGVSVNDPAGAAPRVALYTAAGDGTASYNYEYVPAGSTLAGYTPVDLPDSKIVTSWDVAKTDTNGKTTTQKAVTDLSKVYVGQYSKIEISPNADGVENAETAEFTGVDSALLIDGAKSDGSKDAAYKVDVNAAHPATAPSVVAYVDASQPLPELFTKWASADGASPRPSRARTL